jgi:O-antigen ligase
MKAVGTSSSYRADPGIEPVPSSAAPDVIGALLLTGCAGWTLYTASGRDAHPEGVLLALLAVAAGYAAGRVSGAIAPLGTPATAALAVGLLVPLTAPLRSADADGALLALAVGAACCAAHLAHGRKRLLLAGLALALGAETLATGSMAGTLAAGAALAVSGAVASTRRRLPVLALLALCAGLAAATPLLLTDAHSPLLDHRTPLWRDAVQEAAAAPLTGVGPGRFAELSPSAQETSASGGASSAALQLAAEQGLPGLCLLAGSYGWMLWTLRRAPGPTPMVLTAAGALTALAAEAAVSPVLSFPGITASAGLLAGLASARPLPAGSAEPRCADGGWTGDAGRDGWDRRR